MSTPIRLFRGETTIEFHAPDGLKMIHVNLGWKRDPDCNERVSQLKIVVEADEAVQVNDLLSLTAERLAGALAADWHTAPAPTRHGRDCRCTPCKAEDWDAIDAGIRALDTAPAPTDQGDVT